jgi:hypothetical protein
MSQWQGQDGSILVDEPGDYAEGRTLMDQALRRLPAATRTARAAAYVRAVGADPATALTRGMRDAAARAAR